MAKVDGSSVGTVGSLRCSVCGVEVGPPLALKVKSSSLEPPYLRLEVALDDEVLEVIRAAVNEHVGSAEDADHHALELYAEGWTMAGPVLKVERGEDGADPTLSTAD